MAYYWAGFEQTTTVYVKGYPVKQPTSLIIYLIEVASYFIYDLANLVFAAMYRLSKLEKTAKVTPDVVIFMYTL